MSCLLLSSDQIGAILLMGYNWLLVEYVGRNFQPGKVSTFTVLIEFYLPEAAESAELPTLIRHPERYMALSTQNSCKREIYGIVHTELLQKRDTWHCPHRTPAQLKHWSQTKSHTGTDGIHLRVAYVTETFLTHPQSLDFTAFSKDLFNYLQGWSLIFVSMFDDNLLGSQLW